jgi:hypothetical protein
MGMDMQEHFTPVERWGAHQEKAAASRYLFSRFASASVTSGMSRELGCGA